MESEEESTAIDHDREPSFWLCHLITTVHHNTWAYNDAPSPIHAFFDLFRFILLFLRPPWLSISSGGSVTWNGTSVRTRNPATLLLSPLAPPTSRPKRRRSQRLYLDLSKHQSTLRRPAQTNPQDTARASHPTAISSHSVPITTYPRLALPYVGMSPHPPHVLPPSAHSAPLPKSDTSLPSPNRSCTAFVPA